MKRVIRCRVGESIIIDGKIIMTVLPSKGDTVRLSVDLPDDICIYPEELYLLQCENNEKT